MSAKRSFFILLLIMLITGICGTAEATTSWLSNYSNRVVIPVNATAAGAQTNYQMQIILHSKSGDNIAGDIYLNGNLQDTTNFNDIRFTASDGTTLKDFWIQNVANETGGRKATVYVKLDTPASGSTDYYLYYGKSDDTSASNYDNTFTKDYGESGLAGLWHMDTAPGTELLTDGGLETWTTTTDLTNWTENATSTARQITQESTIKQAGSYSVKLLANSNDGTTDFGIHQDITTVNNETYQVNFYQEYSSRTQGALKVEAWDNTHSVSLGSQSITATSTSFSFISFRFTSTNTTSVRIKVYLNDETNGTIYVDSLSVKQSSNTLIDSSGNSNTGTINGASGTDTDGGQWDGRSDVVFSTGSALQFDGVNDYVDAGNAASLDITGAITVEAWVKLNNKTAFQNILSKGSSFGGSTNYMLGIYNNYVFWDFWAGGTRKSKTVSINSLSTETWNHFVGVYDGSNSIIYINEVATTPSSFGSLTLNTNSVVLSIGRASNGFYFNGTIDEVRIYNRALSADEISRHYIRSKYASTAPEWATPATEEQGALGTSTRNATLITQTGATLNGYLNGLGGDTSATAYFKWGLSQDNLDQTTASQILSDYGSFSQGITNLTSNTTYYFQAYAQNNSTTTQGEILSFTTAAKAGAWLLSDYSHRVKIPVNATAAGAQTDYQMQIILHSKSGDNIAGDIYLNGNLQDTTNFNDIRFTASDGTTLKDFWIQKVEDETGGRKAIVYVKLDTPASGTTDYYIYYGKSGDTSASSYDNTFTKDYGESGLVGLWHMDEGGTATTTADSSGNGYNGTLSTGVTWSGFDGGQWDSSTSTIFATGSALSFDGAAGYVSTGAKTTALDSSDMTVSAWINPSSLTGTIIGRGLVHTSNYYGWRVYLSNDTFGLTRNLGTSGFYSASIGGFLTADVFQLVTVTFNYSTGATIFYVNGTQVYSPTLTTGTIAYSASYDNGISIGTQDYKTGRGNYFKGQIDEVRVYNRELSAGEIARQYIRSKYASTSPIWATPATEESVALGVSTQNATLITPTSATLNGNLSGLGGDSSADVYFKWGLSSDNLDQITASQIFTDYGFFSQPITGPSPDTIYYFQAFVQNSSTTTQGSILSFKTEALETDYYGVVTNTDGSLTFTNKPTGATILSNSPTFYLNYGATTSTHRTLTDPSFEDATVGQKPAGWTFSPFSPTNTVFEVSSDFASDGTKSLKFNMTGTEIASRAVYSPLMSVTQDARYTLTVDSYLSHTYSVEIGMYIDYYSTSNGSGPSIQDTTSVHVSNVSGSWKTNTINWTPPASARSFRIMLYAGKSENLNVYFDNITLTEITNVYTSNGSITPTVSSSGDNITITAIDNSVSTVTVSHKYELNLHSPDIKYTLALTYKQNVYITEERFDFVVPCRNAQVMTRDLKLTPFNTSKTYWSDLYTPKVVRFANGLSFLGSDTMESMRLRTSGSNSQISFYSDYGQNHPHLYYIKNGGGATTSVNETQRTAGDTYSASVTFAIDTNESLPYLVKTRQPYGYDATLTLTNHPDSETLARIKAVAYGTENESDPDYGKKGIASRGIGWTKGVFVSGALSQGSGSYADLSQAAFKTLIDQMYQDGVVIVGHSITPLTDSRAVVAAGLATLSQYNARCWIDHSAADGSSNFEDLASQGAIKGSDYYILDLLDQYNYQYAWSYIDLTTDNYALNMLKPSATADIRPFLFYNNRVDDNVYDNKKIYLWSTINTLKTPDLFYTNDRVDSLISERGVHIGHEYFGISTCQNHAWYNNCGTIEIWPTFDSQLAYIAGKQAAGLLWSPPRAELGDYLVPLKDVLVTYNSDGTITVTNNSLVDVTGITLLAENNIQSVIIDNYDLVSFGDSYGDKEMVLPTIASGDSVVLDISYGAKDSSVPTIVSNDTGKNKVNEITGYWDGTNKILTMTAEGRSGDYSFTVTIPSLANKTIIVKDVTTDTIIGKYNASDSGAIIFTASLDSLHTFKIIVEKPFVDNFDSYGSDCELRNVWHPNPSLVWLNTDPNFVRKGNSMKYGYENNAEVEVNTEYLPCQIGSDWTVESVKALVLYFYGDPCNSILPMYVKLKDGSGNEGVVTYGDNGEDPNDLRAAGWHEWNIDLAIFDACGVDLTNVKYIYLGFGSGNGSGTVYFDDIRLYPPRCVLSKRSADFARLDYAPLDSDGYPGGDCVIDYQELAIMADYWLDTWSPIPPSIPNLVAYWPMNEGAGNGIFTDPCDPCYAGTFSAAGVSWTTPGVTGLGSGALHFDGSSGTRVSCGNDNPASEANELTLAIWAKWLGPRTWNPYLYNKSQGLISKRTDWSPTGLQFMFECDTPPDHRGSFSLRQYDDLNTDVYSPNNILYGFIGQWVHLAATFDGTTSDNACNLYLNGNEVASGPFFFGSNTAAGLTIGNTNDEAGWDDCPESFNGYLDEARIYNRALTEDEIGYLADQGRPHIDLYSDCVACPECGECPIMIDFKDFAVLANYWLEEQLWPYE